MAAAALSPRVRILAICDGVRESRIEGGVFNLKGVRQWLIADRFPFVPSRLWLFLVLTSPRPGVFPGYVRFVNDKTDKTVFFCKLGPTPTFDAHNDYWASRNLIQCGFPEQGRYTLQVWFFKEQGSDILKAEMPFTIATERT